jgi:hypothetical protein
MYTIRSDRRTLLLAAGLCLTGSLACLEPRSEPLTANASPGPGPNGTLPPDGAAPPALLPPATDARPVDGSTPLAGDAGADVNRGPTGYSVTISIVGRGQVRSPAGDIACTGNCSAFVRDRRVTLMAVPDTGALFQRWAGACEGTQPTCTFEISEQETSANTVSAVFAGRGDALWTVPLEGYAESLQVTDDAVVVAGSFSGTSNVGGAQLQSLGMSDAFLAKVTLSGDLVWARAFGGPVLDGFRAMVPDGRGGFGVGAYGGASSDFGNGRIGGDSDNVRLVAGYDGEGRLLWSVQDLYSRAIAWLGDRFATGAGYGVVIRDDRGRKIGNELVWGGVEAATMHRTNQGGFVIAGWYYQNTEVDGRMLVSGGSDDPLIVKFTPGGAVAWVTTFRGPGIDDVNYQMAIDDRDDVYLAGSVDQGITIGDARYSGAGGWLVKLRGSDGRPLWSRFFASGDAFGIAAIDGDVIISGLAIDDGGDGWAVARLSGATGERVWINTETPPMDKLAVRNGRLFGAGVGLVELVP